MTPDTSFADHILDALSLAFKPISRTVLLRALNEAGSRSATGAKRTASQQAALVKELIARGDIIEINRELTVPIHIFERCARRCERDGSYLWKNTVNTAERRATSPRRRTSCGRSPGSVRIRVQTPQR